MFNVGDRVRIKENADEIGEGICHWAPAMNIFLGYEGEIIGINLNGTYVIKGCEHTGANHGSFANWWWFDEQWLEPADDNVFSLDENDILKLMT